MKITARSRWFIRLQNAGFYLLFATAIALLGGLSAHYHYQADWTAGNRNSLSATSQALLKRLSHPVEITAFVQPNKALRQGVSERIQRFQRYKSDISLQFINPDLQPDRAAKAGISRAGQLLLSMHGRSETADDLTESTLINALQRLARPQSRWAVFLQGHGERDPLGDNNQGLGTLTEALKHSGLQVQTLNLVRTPAIPQNTSLLVIAGPQTELMTGEVKRIDQYVADGGNLLWLRDPGEAQGLQPLTQLLGLRFVKGVIVDANQQLRSLLGIKHPAVVPVVDYPTHVLTRNLRTLTLFPYASGIGFDDKADDWQRQPILRTLGRSWSETGSLVGDEVSFHQADGDTAGPLTIGLSLTRKRPNREQRIVVIGDSDFLANGYLGNGGNQELAMNVFNWLSQDDALISIITKRAPDTQLNLNSFTAGAIALSFLVVLPLGLLVTGYTLWFRRRRR